MIKSTSNHPISKHIRLATMCGVCLFPIISQGEILVQSSSNFWSSEVNTTLNPGNARSGGATEDITVETQVDQYTGTEDLTRVVISILQSSILDPSNPSSIMSLDISGSNGSATTTSNESQNHMLKDSHLTRTSIDDDLNAFGQPSLGGNPATTTYYVEHFSDPYANTPIGNGDSINRTVDISNGPIIIFDSSNTLLTSAQLNSLFAGTGTIDFDMELTSGFRWDFEDAGQYPDLTAVIDGINSGDIQIDYYMIPEPGTFAMMAIALSGAGGLALLRRRKRD